MVSRNSYLHLTYQVEQLVAAFSFAWNISRNFLPVNSPPGQISMINCNFSHRYVSSYSFTGFRNQNYSSGGFILEQHKYHYELMHAGYFLCNVFLMLLNFYQIYAVKCFFFLFSTISCDTSTRRKINARLSEKHIKMLFWLSDILNTDV